MNIVKEVSIEGHKETAAAESAVNLNFDKDHHLEEQQNEISIVVEEPPTKNNENQVPETHEEPTPAKKPILRKKSSTLRHTIDAENEFKVSMDAKIRIKKTELMKRIASAKKRKVDASERQAGAEERTASANGRNATVLETIAESIVVYEFLHIFLHFMSIFVNIEM
ncbi:hypothetical protein JTB14_006702 [Gonioctena quinquepunctata]|nr:hypothetical protein JTB14_006702 [Gonioctena quinquepunctata]